MILVDSSVWIDVLHDRSTVQTSKFRSLLERRIVTGVADLVAAEVLQGTRGDRNFEDTRKTLAAFPWFPILDPDVVIGSAKHYRSLRALGITIRKTIDTLIATRCILDTFRCSIATAISTLSFSISALGRRWETPE